MLVGDKVYHRFALAPREHTKLLLPMMDAVLDEAGIGLPDVDAIAFSRGPGAFTGLRIATGVAQGVALAADKPVIPVSTLAALAYQAIEKQVKTTTVVAALDARMGEVYWGIYQIEGNNVVLDGEEQVSKPEDMFLATINCLNTSNKADEITVLTGPGWDAYASAFQNDHLQRMEQISPIEIMENSLPTAAAIAQLALPMFLDGKGMAAEDAQPVYIRNKVAEKSKKV